MLNWIESRLLKEIKSKRKVKAISEKQGIRKNRRQKPNQSFKRILIKNPSYWVHLQKFLSPLTSLPIWSSIDNADLNQLPKYNSSFKTSLQTTSPGKAFLISPVSCILLCGAGTRLAVCPWLCFSTNLIICLWYVYMSVSFNRLSWQRSYVNSVLEITLLPAFRPVPGT